MLMSPEGEKAIQLANAQEAKIAKLQAELADLKEVQQSDYAKAVAAVKEVNRLQAELNELKANNFTRASPERR